VVAVSKHFRTTQLSLNSTQPTRFRSWLRGTPGEWEKGNAGTVLANVYAGARVWGIGEARMRLRCGCATGSQQH